MTGDLEFGDWLRLGEFVIPAVVRLDVVSVSLAIFSSCLTAIIARFSRTYLHKEPGFIRFFALLGVFATGTQLIALAADLELFFAGWELIGLASAFFIGFFKQLLNLYNFGTFEVQIKKDQLILTQATNSKEAKNDSDGLGDFAYTKEESNTETITFTK